jgi:hypothetical protein
MWLGVVKSTLPNHLMGLVQGFKWSLAQNLDFSSWALNFFGPKMDLAIARAI